MTLLVSTFLQRVPAWLEVQKSSGARVPRRADDRGQAVIEMEGNAAVVYAPRSLTRARGHDLRRSIHLASLLQPDCVVIDFALVDFWDADGLSVLADALRDGYPVRVRNAPSALVAVDDVKRIPEQSGGPRRAARL